MNMTLWIIVLNYLFNYLKTTLIKEQDIFFLPEGTDGLDVGYDAAGLDLSAYSIYTRLVSDDEGLNMDIQTLNFDNMLGKVIPLGININLDPVKLRLVF